jgi:hypothetical protein
MKLAQYWVLPFIYAFIVYLTELSVVETTRI